MPALPAFSSTTLHEVPPAPRAGAMSQQRIVLVALLIAFSVAGQLDDTAVDGDHWPFSSYPMFARPRELLVRVKRLYGVTENGEVPIVVPRHLAPFHEARLMTAFKRIGRRDDRDARLTAALRWTLERYEALRGVACARWSRDLRHAPLRDHLEARSGRVESRRAGRAPPSRRGLAMKTRTVAAARPRVSGERVATLAAAWQRFWFAPAWPDTLGFCRVLFFAVFCCASHPKSSALPGRP